MFPRLYVIDKKPRNWLLLANSVITREHLAKTFQVSDEEITLLNPPVASYAINEMLRKKPSRKRKFNCFCWKARIGKAICRRSLCYEVVKGKIADIKLSLIGFKHEEMKLFKMIKNFELEKNVEILINADRKNSP